MLQYGWRMLSSRPSLWVLALGCALLAALPGALAGTILATPIVAFLVTGNPLLAVGLLPEELTGSPGSAALLWGLVALSLLGALCVRSRLYAAAVWSSDGSNEPGVSSALRGSRARWPAVVRIYVESGLLLLCVLLPIASLAFAAGGGAAGGTSVLVLVAALGARSLIRVTTTLAIRATVLDSVGGRLAWKSAINVLKQRRADAAAVWIALVAIGAALWMGGRIISPVLQDTAFDYPPVSAYAFLREVAQITMAVPLEAFLLVFSFGAWTAVYRDIQARPPGGSQRRQTNPAGARAAAFLLVVTIVSNGIPTVIDSRYTDEQSAETSAIERSEIEPEETLRAAPTIRPSPTSYDVTARLEDEHLTWTTRVAYRNVTGQVLKNLVFHLYPAAYARPLADIPLAGDLLAGDLSGSFRSRARPGTFTIKRVMVDGKNARREANGTSLVVSLPRPLKQGAATNVTIALDAELPVFPERYGVWGEMTLLGNWVPVVAVRDEEGWVLHEFGTVGDPFFSEVADYRVLIEADDRQNITGTGSLTRIQQSSDDTRTWTFDAPGVRDVAFAASVTMRALERTTAGVVVRSWYPAEARALGAANLDTAVAAVGDYSERFGPLPFDEVEVVATSGLLGGMEYPGVVFVGQGNKSLEGVPVLPELLEFAGFADAQRRYVLGHELAHQWWYASVGNDQASEPWLDEALAEASTITWLRRVENGDRTWKMTNLLSEPPDNDGHLYAGVDEFSSNQEYIDSIYRSGAGTVLDLRTRVGGDTFDAILRSYHETNRLEIATAGDFFEAIQKVAGSDVAESFAR
jgi:hypothetical protein